MKKNLPFLLSLVILIITSCSNKKTLKITIDNLKITPKRTPFNDNELKKWFAKDIITDTIPGISLNKAKALINNKTKNITVAVIDTEIDILHKDLAGKFWRNEDEKPNNNVDDDFNGYTDDYQGWNFIGNLKGDNIIYSNYESTRILRKYEAKFDGNDSTYHRNTYETAYKVYKNAKNEYNKKLKKAKSDLDYANFLIDNYPIAKKAIKNIFPDEEYSTKELDSLYNIYKDTDKKLAKNLYFISDFIKYKLSEQWMSNYKQNAINKITKILNKEFNDRKLIDKNPHDIFYKGYGNPYINKNINQFYHGTLIAGLITSINDKIKIMPLAISSNGDEHDKDIALAIKYAVDNGAKIINLSFSKQFSLEKKWVFNALKYAQKNNVLIISSAGNLKLNLNSYNNSTFPNDKDNNGEEVSNNFLLVGSISNKLNSELLSYFSNYGNIDVDIFAPGENIYSTLPNNNYKFESGTSLACAITSGVASLILSSYPDLTATQVKLILMESGIKYSLKVNTPTPKKQTQKTPLYMLSKSGKVLNAYNALIMADSISKK
ncbi:Peptidase_S8 domain-containing protein [Tenacibaculum sp. 190524A02b]|uniref:Peptidase_S8 domain-containing protein n=1 Tax=Tenacibaculum vairaonense TaxID=3137860 RepID=A0ABM9PK34_9FLAO